MSIQQEPDEYWGEECDCGAIANRRAPWRRTDHAEDCEYAAAPEPDFEPDIYGPDDGPFPLGRGWP